MDADATELVRRYYDALDEHAYDVLEEVLAPTFVQRRPDRTFEDRSAFIRFMREERPRSDTTHEIRDLFVGSGNRVVSDGSESHVVSDGSESCDGSTGRVAAARGRLLDGDGSLVIEFADHFEIDPETGRIDRLETYVR